MFTSEEQHKIQAMVDLLTTYFPFEVNGRTLETGIVQGGMGVDISGIDLGVAVAKTGSVGTISTTGSRHLADIKRFDRSSIDGILGINNLVACVDYERNYTLGQQGGYDFIASGAGISPAIIRRIKGQEEYVTKDSMHYWTWPIVSGVEQLAGHMKRNVGISILENEDAGGHNGKGLDTNGTIEALKEYNTGNLKVIFAGGIRTPELMVRALDAGAIAVQMGTPFLLAEETNIKDEYRKLVLHAKPGDVRDIVSPSGLLAKGFWDEGIMKRVLAGEPCHKHTCEASRTKGCLINCTKIDLSAKAAGAQTASTYCIRDALHVNNRAKPFDKEDPLFFCGMRPESLFYKNEMIAEGVNTWPARKIIGKFLAGVYEAILGSDLLKDEHRRFLEGRTYQENQYTAKMLQN